MHAIYLILSIEHFNIKTNNILKQHGDLFAESLMRKRRTDNIQTKFRNKFQLLKKFLHVCFLFKVLIY